VADDQGDNAARTLTQQQRRELPEAFSQHFHTTLQQQVSPDPAEVTSWLKQYLGIKEASYGSDCGDISGMESGADEAGDTAAVPAGGAVGSGVGDPSRQQGRRRRRKRNPQQQRQQQQQAQPLRRSGRTNAGCMSAAYAAVHGPVGHTQRNGGVGGGTSQQASGAGSMPLTPAATHTPRRARQSAQGPS
jgi:transcription initiation factor TFIID subunit TAF12